MHKLTCLVTAANGVVSSPTEPRASIAQPASGRQTSPKTHLVTEAQPSNEKSIAPAANDSSNIVRRKLTGYVGFANLPNQWHRKSVRKGFNFNVMVVGRSSP